MTDRCLTRGPDGRVRTHEIRGETLYVGRSANNDLQVADGFVSRRHLKITRRGERFFIKDLFSKNGTFLNGELMNAGVDYPLPEGVPVIFGMSVFCLGEGCSEELLDLLGSGHRPGADDAENGFPGDRPLTEDKNRELVYKIYEDMARNLDLREMLRRVLDHVFDVFVRIERGAIFLVDSETGRISEAVSKTKQGMAPMQYSKEVVKRVIQHRQAVMISDAEADQSEEDLPETLKLLNIKSVMCIPLVSRSKLKGLLYADSVTRPYGFRGEDLYLLSALGSPLAEVIEKSLPPPVDSPGMA